MMGVTIVTCARIIAVGVNNSPNTPSGPERERSRYTTKPTTTGGRPIRALRTMAAVRRPGKCKSATAAPNGKPMIAAPATPVRLIRTDSRTISSSPASSRTISLRADWKASKIVCKTSRSPLRVFGVGVHALAPDPPVDPARQQFREHEGDQRQDHRDDGKAQRRQIAFWILGQGVDRDGNRARLAGDVAHEDDGGAELAKTAGKGQHHACQQAG